MPFDALIANPGRLSILTALAQAERQEFVQLRSSTRMTDGNLATHARRLHSAGMLDIDKSFRNGKPVPPFTLTPQGRAALESHLNGLMHALRPADSPALVQQKTPKSEFPLSTVYVDESDWID
jgi:DNA-binding MarR family transcriptional regulator